MAIDAGKLRERITIYRSDYIRTVNGEQLAEWKPVMSARCQVIMQRSSRAFSNGEQWYPTARTFKLRYPPELKGGDRIEYRGEMYQAMPPKIFDRDGYQEVDCDLISE